MKLKGLGSLAIAVGVSLLIAALRLRPPTSLQLLELRAVDFRQQIRGPVPVGDEIAIVAVDEQSLVAFGRWPWRRERIAALISELTRLGAAVIGLDIVFAEPEPEGDATLAEAIRRSGKVVLGYFVDLAGRAESAPAADLAEYNLVRPGLGESPGELQLHAAPRIVGNVPGIAAAAAGHAGYFNMLPDGDGIFRRVLLAIRDVSSPQAKRLLVPLPLEILRRTEPDALLAVTFDDDGVAGLTLGRRPIPVDRYGDLWVSYAGPRRTFPHHSAGAVLNGKIDAAAIRDRIVIVGVTATGAYDIRATPLDPAFPGVEVHANVIENILRDRALRRPWWLPAADVGVIVLLGVALGAALQRFKGAGGMLFSLGALGVYLAGSQQLFVRSGIPLSAVHPLMLVFFVYPGVTLLHYFTEVRTKRQIRDAFSLYLQPEVATMVSEDPEKLRLGGDKRELTVLFSDVRDFTAASENAEPEMLVEFMNEYLGAMTDVVFAHDGLLDKYIGDAIMALWGAPVADPAHAAKACRAALGMTARLEELEPAWQRLAGDHGGAAQPPLRVGIGVNTGAMVVGNIGSSQRFNYTVMGDNVNLASRLEGLNKLYGTRILVTEGTREKIGEEFVLRELDAVRVKGKQRPVRVFELLAAVEDRARLAAFTEDFAAALAAYQQRDWQKAKALFEEFLRRHPEDGPARIYLDRCRTLYESPPAPDWDGVYSAATKSGGPDEE